MTDVELFKDAFFAWCEAHSVTLPPTMGDGLGDDCPPSPALIDLIALKAGVAQLLEACGGRLP